MIRVGGGMSSELWLEILHHLVLSSAPTTMPIQSHKVELRAHVLENRRTLWAACQVSRQVGACAREYLYQSILINNCQELLYIFRTLRTVPELRSLVRSFSWTGVLPQSDGDETECIELMPYLLDVFASLPFPISDKDILLHHYLNADNISSFRFWRLLAAILAILPKITTLFLSLGWLMPGPELQQSLIDTELGGGGTSAQREQLFRLQQKTHEVFAIAALLERYSSWEDYPLTSLGYPLLPELQVLILDHTSDRSPRFEAVNIDYIVDDLNELCPRLRYIQTKSSISPSPLREPILRGTNMRHLLLRRQRSTISTLPQIQAIYPNLTSLCIIGTMLESAGAADNAIQALASLQRLQRLSLSTPHNLTWYNQDPYLPLSKVLRQMISLQHLRIDMIWLADRSDPSLLFRIASVLPTSIQSLHLLDYWAVSMTSFQWERHPVFPENMSALEFMRLVLENLLQNCRVEGLTNLREVKLSSREYAKDRSHWTGARQSLFRLIWRFLQAGIRLIVNGHEEARDEEDDWWLNLD
ncbi:hypothetical protein F5Y08DRAFT_350756 [Xylaria arbuscula]|nr:hypothetical protein F5Y08DRAFT_350756 [Xylaria arbuscula]